VTARLPAAARLVPSIDSFERESRPSQAATQAAAMAAAVFGQSRLASGPYAVHPVPVIINEIQP
jgi:hypothetical protein